MYLILFLLFQAQKRKPEGTPEGRGRKKKLKLWSGSQPMLSDLVLLVLVSVFVEQAVVLK